MDGPDKPIKSYDNAYLSFLLCGVFVLLVGIISFVPVDTGTAGGIGFFVLIPLSFLTLIAFATGLFLSIRLRKHAPIALLAILTILFMIEMITELGSPVFYNLTGFVYSLIAIALPLRWFLVLRKRYINGSDWYLF